MIGTAGNLHSRFWEIEHRPSHKSKPVLGKEASVQVLSIAIKRQYRGLYKTLESECHLLLQWPWVTFFPRLP